MKKQLTTTENQSRNSKNPLSRRGFMLKTTLTLGAVTIVPRHVLGMGFVAPSDKINLGFIGLGKQGEGLARRFINETSAQIVAGSDVWRTKNKWFRKQVQKQYAQLKRKGNYEGVTTYGQYKELLERKDIDAVVIATPDHWHAIQSIDTMNAGKHLFCEKPLSHRVSEGMAMVKTAAETGMVVQTGSMQRSWENFRKAAELVRNGYLGEIQKVLVNVGDPARTYDLLPEKLPKKVDWNLWCGPAPMLAYNHRLAPSKNKVEFWPDWRKFKETGGGILCDWGAHMFDIAQWALGMDRTGPVRYLPPENPGAVRGLRMFYANGIEMVHHDFDRGWGVRFIGSEGSLDISRNYLESNPASILNVQLKESDIHLYDSKGNHYQDWLDAIKNKTTPICDVETGHRSASICNLANIAYQLGRELNWDPVEEKFREDDEANSLLSRKNRDYS